MTIKAECTHCGAEFDAETMTWADNRETGETAWGGNSKTHEWYGQSGDAWPEEEVYEYEQQVGGIGQFGKCPKCVDRSLRAQERAAEYNTPCAPSWFDPGYAGEHWDEDY